MFIHQFVGCLIFLLLGKLFNQNITFWFLMKGVVIASLPDVLYAYEVTKKKILTGDSGLDKNSHLHRQGFTHTIYFPFVVTLITLIINPDLSILVFLASVSHPILDMWGIGWGVKLLAPRGKTYKLFYRDKIVYTFTDEELKVHAEKYGVDDWFRRVYFTFDAPELQSWYGKMEWWMFVATVSILLISL